jgi:hypothetical protein
MTNVTELFVLINATWSALHTPGIKLDPVSERIAREVDAIFFNGGCPLNCCEAPETALAYVDAAVDPVPAACKEARQIEKCITRWGSHNEHVCIDIVTDTDVDAKRHNKKLIKKAAKMKRAALTKRLQFLLDDLADEVTAYNVVLASESLFSLQIQKIWNRHPNNGSGMAA